MLALLLVFVLLAILLIVRMPVAFAMGLSGVLGLLTHFGPAPALSVLDRILFDKTSSFILVAIPLFILMAEIMSAGGTVGRAIDACKAWIGHLRGGLAYAAVGASVLLAALIGSSTASSAAMSATIYPEMKKNGYDDRFSTGVIAVGGTLAVMIPPSIALIFYGVLTETSIGRLFIAGVVPGLLTAAGFIVVIAIMARREGVAPSSGTFSLPFAMRTSSGALPIAALIVLVISSIYTGMASPTEAGAVGVTGAFILAILHRSAKAGEMWRCVSNTIRTTVAVVAIIACSAIFTNYLTFTQVTPTLLNFIEASGLAPWMILAMVIIFLLILGMFMDQLAILSLTMPLAFPIIFSLGYDPVWFGIIVTKTVEIGLFTPPLGLNVYIVSGQTGVPLRSVFRGVMPFLIAEGVVLLFLVFFPQISLLLPGMMR